MFIKKVVFSFLIFLLVLNSVKPEIISWFRSPLRYYHRCYLKTKCVTSDRNEVTAADNKTTNDTYEYIEGATNNQRKKGKNYIIHLPLCNTCRQHSI